MKIYDCFTTNGEYDLLEIRFNILSRFVDKFLIVENTETFSGNPKPLYWEERDKERFKEWEDKVIYHVVRDYSDEYLINQALARDYVSTNAFRRSFYQKESIRKVLEGLCLEDEDVVIYGDADEIINPEIIAKVDDKIHKLRQFAYSYYLNNRSPEDWRGTIITKWKNLKGRCLNDLRANPIEEDIWENGGWHFTNIGGIESIKNKIASYDHQECNIPFVNDNLEERIKNNVDFLGRGFKMWVSEEGLPDYILENKQRYQHLWKN